MASTVETTMEVVGMVHTKDNVRLIIQNTETGKKYRVKVEDFFPLVSGSHWVGEWEISKRGRYSFAKHVGWGSYPD